MNCRLKPILISGHAHCLEPGCEYSGIAILAARRNVRTPAHRIPGVLRPLYLATHAVVRRDCVPVTFYSRSLTQRNSCSRCGASEAAVKAAPGLSSKAA